MALTLVESAKYSNDVLQKGVLQKFVRRDPILQKLPFKDIVGNGLTYDVEATEATANFYAVGDTWTEGTHTVAQTTANLKILGGDVDVDNFLKSTRSDKMDLQQEALDAKVKAVKKTWMQRFYYGYSPTWTNEFDGLQYLIRSTTNPYENVVAVSTGSGTPATLSLEKLDEAIDLLKGFSPDLIISSHKMFRMVQKYLRSVGGATYDMVMGEKMLIYDGIPWSRSDYVSNDESCDLEYQSGTYGCNYADGSALGDDDNSTTIFILTFDPKGCCGVQTSPMQIEKVGTGNLETKDATRHRIKWYASMMMQNILSCSKVTGVDPTSTTTA